CRKRRHRALRALRARPLATGHTAGNDGAGPRTRHGGTMPRTPLLRLPILLALATGTGAVHAQQASRVAPALLPSPSVPTLSSVQGPDAILSWDAQVAAEMALPEELRLAVAQLGLTRGVPSLDRVKRLYEFMVGTDGLALR